MKISLWKKETEILRKKYIYPQTYTQKTNKLWILNMKQIEKNIWEEKKMEFQV